MTKEPQTISADDYTALAAKQKPAKYRNVKTEVDGILFDSKAEARRYGELMLMWDAGEICDLRLHPRYELVVDGVRICWYVADFAYTINATDEPIVEDTKGCKTAVYRLKKKLMYACRGIDVREVTG